MRIEVARLDREGETLEGEDPADILEWDPQDELLSPEGPVRYRVRAERVGAELLVRGSARARFRGVCVRCGGPLDLEVLDEDFCVSLALPEEVQQVDLTPELRESILIALPSHPVCRPDCSGVCPRCGSRRTEGGCGCIDPDVPGWEALSDLTVPR